MKLIIVQGSTCLGKSTLSKKLIKLIPNSKYMCVDTYKEILWDSLGFANAKERNELSLNAKKWFIYELAQVVETNKVDTILIDYPLSGTIWQEVIKVITENNITDVYTLNLYCNDLKSYKEVWTKRNFNKKERHPAHGANIYHNGKGFDYDLIFEDKIKHNLPTYGNVLDIEVNFFPYSTSKSFDEITEFLEIEAIHE